MKLAVIFTDQAIRDLDAIEAFIAVDNPVRAVSYALEIVDACMKLGEMPELGRRRDELGQGRRSFSFRRRQTIIYRSLTDRVTVVRIYSTGRDVLRDDQGDNN
ncbi:type II toxin-antitoxin system RelE/ParE family toxin [Tianweitania populi]|uniref:Type II toxin-antitoxin system RelE/ParE family toxin n=1 Tax=Tianweitania populi TaxID=1607949 RepID=A0A8J3GL64_9HYPH|nr:type II toxin-antitoxin system RelE/ParE family toxin [Tianweitania populi]GHD20011.1 hypothetical protein GCM10016234_32390 [Tianweitania populi]